MYVEDLVVIGSGCIDLSEPIGGNTSLEAKSTLSLVSVVPILPAEAVKPIGGGLSEERLLDEPADCVRSKTSFFLSPWLVSNFWLAILHLSTELHNLK